MSDNKLIIGFSKPKEFKLLSWLIRTVEKTEYSHVYIKSYNQYFSDYDVYQASKSMVNHVLEPQFLNENIIISEFSVDLELHNKKSVLLYLRNRLGKPYSLFTLAIMALSKLGIKSNKWHDQENAFICSELAARTLVYSGKISYELDLDKATPKQLYDICNEHFERIT